MEEVIKKYLSSIGTKGGKAKSSSKTHAVRENGKKGGRPGPVIDIDMLTEEEIVSTGD